MNLTRSGLRADILCIIKYFLEECQGWVSANRRPRIVRQRQLSVGPPRGDAVGHDPFVELAQIEGRATAGGVVLAQLERRELAEEVAAVGRVVGAADGLLARGRAREVRFALEERGGLIDR